MAVSKDEFRRALGNFASGVTVVTSKCEDNQLRGLTVSAFSSVSLEPPLVLICLDHRCSLHDFLKEGLHFAVNILAEDQMGLSNRFASRDPNRFDGVNITDGVTGAPLIEGAVAHIECRVVHAYAGGDHTIYVGEVEATQVTDSKPLAYFRGNYAQVDNRQ
jgi:flavin reductase (DIM6/NTAB) family NADH-FMN oxidoreductase RutF